MNRSVAQRIITGFLCTGFVLLLFGPLVQWYQPVVTERLLGGKQVTTIVPDRTWQTLWDGSYQTAFASWVEEQLGFRTSLILTDNQIYFSLFKEMSPRPIPLVLGKENTLYEKDYIDAYHNKNAISQEEITVQVEKLELLEQQLRERGVDFLFLLSPTKAHSYPEYIPDRLQADIQETNYERLVYALANSSLTYFDSSAYFEQVKPTVPYDLFTTAGTHWSFYGACRAVQAFTTFVLDGPRATCDPYIVHPAPQGTDRDLVQYVNAWNDRFADNPTPLPTVAMVGEPLGKVTFIGDSFIWNITQQFDAKGWYNERHVWYYNATAYRRVGAGEQILEEITGIGTDDWAQDILSSDLVIIEATHTAITNIGFGFVDQLLHWFNRQ